MNQGGEQLTLVLDGAMPQLKPGPPQGGSESKRRGRVSASCGVPSEGQSSRSLRPDCWL
jgi:hypothetical protein